VLRIRVRLAAPTAGSYTTWGEISGDVPVAFSVATTHQPWGLTGLALLSLGLLGLRWRLRRRRGRHAQVG
jgi:hypothetical protein